MTAGFQTQVYDQPAAAVAGDRASMNPLYSYNVGPGGLVAGAAGVTIGRFAWVAPPDDPNGTPSIASSTGVGSCAGFVMRSQQGSNPTYLSDAGNTILSGYPLAIMVDGDFWVKNEGTTFASRGQKAYASYSNGAASFAATSSPTTGASATGSSIAAETFSVTGAVQGGLLNVTAVGSGTVYPGATISGSGVTSGTQVTSQVSGTAGGIGVYAINYPDQTVASTTISGTYGLLTVGTLTTTPTFQVGDQLNATGSVVAGTQITANVTGSGGSGGTLVVNNNTVVSSQTISALSNVETPWVALSEGAVGEVVKIGRSSASTLLS